MLVSGGQPGDILATAHLLADSGARLALVGGPAKPAELAAVDLALARLRRAGTVVSYATADISDPDQAEAVVARIEEQTGPVTAVCYPASSGLRDGCTELPADQVRALISAQADGLSNLLGAISAARLRLLLTVSALPARYGAARHGAASLSAAALAEQARRLGQGLPGCRVLHADLPWPPGSGPAAPAELGRLLMNTLAHRAAATRIAIHGRLGRGTGADRGDKSSGRFLETVRVHCPRVELVAEARVSTRTDPYLADYLLDGRTVLPPAIGLEAMAQAAAALAGRPLRDLADVSMEAPVVLPPGDGETTLRVCALLRDDGVETVLRAAGTGFSLDHVRAFFPLRSGAAPPPARRASRRGRAGQHRGRDRRVWLDLLPAWRVPPGCLPDRGNRAVLPCADPRRRRPPLVHPRAHRDRQVSRAGGKTAGQHADPGQSWAERRGHAHAAGLRPGPPGAPGRIPFAHPDRPGGVRRGPGARRAGPPLIHRA